MLQHRGALRIACRACYEGVSAQTNDETSTHGKSIRDLARLEIAAKAGLLVRRASDDASLPREPVRSHVHRGAAWMGFLRRLRGWGLAVMGARFRPFGRHLAARAARRVRSRPPPDVLSGCTASRNLGHHARYKRFLDHRVTPAVWAVLNGPRAGIGSSRIERKCSRTSACHPADHLMAMHERSSNGQNAVPFAAILANATGKFAEPAVRRMVQDAATKLTIQKLLWA
jgi:hypothetical protein